MIATGFSTDNFPRKPVPTVRKREFEFTETEAHAKKDPSRIVRKTLSFPVMMRKRILIRHLWSEGESWIEERK